MSILDAIIEHKREEVQRRKHVFSLSSLHSLPGFTRETASLSASLRAHHPFAVIAEIKRSSPSAGAMNSVPEPAAFAQSYENCGAAAISVLTDAKYFGGSVDDLLAVRTAVAIPVLRKEFVIDPYQIAEAKAYGADAILLIAAILDRSQLSDLHAAAVESGLEVLVEIHDADELPKLDAARMPLVGINNRNLHTMTTDYRRTLEIAAQIPPGAFIVSESGLHTPSQIRELMAAGIHAGLIGEFLMKSPDPGRTLRTLLEGACR